jgi:hypothetical protein
MPDLLNVGFGLRHVIDNLLHRNPHAKRKHDPAGTGNGHESRDDDGPVYKPFFNFVFALHNSLVRPAPLPLPRGQYPGR